VAVKRQKRTSFGSNIQSGGDASKPSTWPNSLKDYVERSFATATTQAHKTHIETALKSIITKAIKNNELWTTNWTAKKPLGAPGGKKQKKQKKKKDKFSFASVTTPSDNLAFHQKQGAMLASRMRRFAVKETPTTKPKKKKRGILKRTVVNGNVMFNAERIDWDSLTIQGTMETLEKKYFRLTSVPEPSTIRPERVLKRSLVMIKRKWSQNEDWSYCREQLKSVRQDLTVQNIKNDFSVEVYETNARLCLENMDLGEYNQCQTRLFAMYQKGTNGSIIEFTAYRVLYTLVENNLTEMDKVITGLSKELREEPAIVHALRASAFFMQQKTKNLLYNFLKFA